MPTPEEIQELQLAIFELITNFEEDHNQIVVYGYISTKINHPPLIRVDIHAVERDIYNDEHSDDGSRKEKVSGKRKVPEGGNPGSNS